jgi:hypothetical protein
MNDHMYANVRAFIFGYQYITIIPISVEISTANHYTGPLCVPYYQ